jgi:hypothetical protein
MAEDFAYHRTISPRDEEQATQSFSWARERTVFYQRIHNPIFCICFVICTLQQLDVATALPGIRMMPQSHSSNTVRSTISVEENGPARCILGSRRERSNNGVLRMKGGHGLPWGCGVPIAGPDSENASQVGGSVGAKLRHPVGAQHKSEACFRKLPPERRMFTTMDAHPQPVKLTAPQKAKPKPSFITLSGQSTGALRVLQAAKCFVGLCGAMWCWGCVTGLLAVLRAFMLPGGIEFMERQSSHGLPGVILFVFFTSSQLLFQLFKLWKVMVATKLSEVKLAFLFLSGFNLFFVYMCWWRVSPNLDSITSRDAMILFEAVCMIIVVFMYWLRQPWRARGRTLSG